MVEIMTVPTIKMDTQHSLYNHPILELFKRKASFKTQNGQGTWNYAQRESLGNAQYDSYEPKITAINGLCQYCGTKDTAYTVWSYATKIYVHCDKCNKTYCNVNWYSKQTTWLQNALSECFADFKAEYEAHCNEVRKARKWLNTRRRQQYNITSDRLSEKDVLAFYSQYCDE